MSSLRQISSIIAERAGKKRDITFIKEMEDLAVLKGATFIGRSLAKNPSQDKYYLRSFHLNLEKVDTTDECNEDLEDLDCCDKAFRSVEEVPNPLKYGANLFSYVGGLGGAEPYSWTTFGNERYMKHKPLTGKKARYTYINKRIYVFNKDIETIRVEMVASDPRALAKFACCDDCNTPCYDVEKDFFIDEQIAAIIIQDILANELRIAVPNEKIEIKEDKNV